MSEAQQNAADARVAIREAASRAADAAVAIHEAASRAVQLIDEIDGAVRELKGVYGDHRGHDELIEHVEHIVVADTVSAHQIAGEDRSPR
jgi:hypothetical protein